MDTSILRTRRHWRFWALALLVITSALVLLYTFHICNVSDQGTARASSSYRILLADHANRVYVFEQYNAVIGAMERCLDHTAPPVPYEGALDLTIESCMNVAHPERLVIPYVQILFGALLFLPRLESLHRVLVVGLGGGSLPTALHHIAPHTQQDIVEIDPNIVRAARDWFNFTLPVHVGDGAEFVAKAPVGGYDWVVVDAYDCQGRIPIVFTKGAFFANVRKALRRGGVFAINVYDYSAVELKTLRGHLEEGFGPSSHGYELAFLNNVLLFVQKDGGYLGLGDASKRKELVERERALAAPFQSINVDSGWILRKLLANRNANE